MDRTLLSHAKTKKTTSRNCFSLFNTLFSATEILYIILEKVVIKDNVQSSESLGLVMDSFYDSELVSKKVCQYTYITK